MLTLAVGFCPASVRAGPPYVTDDPEPTPLGGFEVYLFAEGTTLRDGSEGSAGIDFNYGAAPDLQLTAVLPLAWRSPDDGHSDTDLGNAELAAKYRFLHQDDVGVDVALFPRVFLRAGSSSVGERHTSLLLPIWLQRTADGWATFGGGGCTLNDDGDSRDFCTLAWAVTVEAGRVQLGAEIYHQTADRKHGHPSTALGFGATVDVTEHVHLMASVGPGIQNARATGEANGYASLLLTW